MGYLSGAIEEISLNDTEEAKGRAKGAIGELTGNDSLERAGETDPAKGKAKGAIDKVADKATGKD